MADDLVDVHVLAYRFASLAATGPAYERARDIVFGTDIDGSVYRVLLSDCPHLVILVRGNVCEKLLKKLSRCCDDGESTEIPVDILALLILRHEQFRVPGTRFERRRGHPPTIDPA